MRFQVANDILEFVRRETEVDRDAKVIDPNLYLSIARANVKMRWLVAFIRVEKGTVPSPT